MDRRQKYRDELDPLRSRIISNETDDSGIFIPSDSVWGNIAEQIDKKSSDKNVILWMLLGIGLSLLFLITFLLANGTNDSLGSIGESIAKPEETFTQEKNQLQIQDDQEGDINAGKEVKSIDPEVKAHKLNNSAGNVREEIIVSDGTLAVKSELVKSLTSDHNNLYSSTNENYQKESKANTLKSHSDGDSDIVRQSVDPKTKKSIAEEGDFSLTHIYALPIKSFYVDSYRKYIPLAANPIHPIPNAKQAPFIISASYITGKNAFSLNGYNGDINFDLSNATQNGLEITIGKSIKRGVSLHLGFNYRQVDFDANYGWMIDRKEMDIQKENPTFLVFGYNADLPSLAGGISNQMVLSTRTENIVDGSLPIQLNLNHSYHEIGFPLLLDLEYNIFGNLDLALSGGIQHTIRRVTIDTEVSGFSSSPFTVLEEIVLHPSTPELLPFKTSYQDVMYGLRINYALTDAIYVTSSYRVQRSIGDIYHDNAFSIGRSSQNFFVGMQYRLD